MSSNAKFIAAFVLLCGPSLAGCAHPDASADEQAPVAAAAEPEVAEPAAVEPAAVEPAAVEPAAVEPGAAESKEMSFTPGELSPNDAGLLEYCLDCRRKSSTYNYCEFDKAALEAAVGPDNMAKEVSVTVSMVAKASSNSVPDDPNAPQPDGGFTHNHFSCTVTALAAE